MTFAEVPMGHIFRFTNCECVYRRVPRLSIYQVVEKCETHQRGGDHWRPLDSRVIVKYDPFAAMLEAIGK